MKERGKLRHPITIVLTLLLLIGSLGIFANTSPLTAVNNIFTANNSVFTGFGKQYSYNLLLQATVTTDKQDYRPGEVANITGSGFGPNDTITLQVVHIEAAPGLTEHQGHEPWTVTADATGNFSASWLVGEDSSYQTLRLTAIGDPSGLTAEHIFTDAPLRTDFHQCANENPTAGDCDWIGSILQQQNSLYFEGMSVPQRLVFDELNPAGTGGNNHELKFSHQVMKGSIHAYDFITSHEQGIRVADEFGVPFVNTQAYTALPLEQTGAFPPTQKLTNAEACDETISLETQCLANRSGLYRYDIPVEDNIGANPLVVATAIRTAAYEARYGRRYVRIYANQPFDLSNLPRLVLDTVTVDSNDASLSYFNYKLSWKSTATSVLIEMAGHLSMSDDTDGIGWGPGNGSSSISGGPYHFKLDSVDTTTIGSQDNQIKGADIQVPQRGSVTIIKRAIGDNGTFDFQGTGDGIDANFPLTTTTGPGGNEASIVFANIQQGAKTVTETGPPDGWQFTSLACVGDTDGGTTVNGQTANIDLDPNENIVCTFTNTKTGRIIVEKQTNPNNSTQSFEFDSDYGANFSLTDGQENDSGALAPGTYSVAELLPTGWDVDNVLCSDNSPRNAIQLAAGETVRCVFTNTQRGSVTVIKDAVPDDPQDFLFAAGGGLTPTSFTLDDDGNNGNGVSNTTTFADVAPGSGYTLSETVPTGWDQTSATCDDGSLPSNIDVGAGENVTCTFVNTKKATVRVVKVAVGGNDTFDFDGTGGLPPDFDILTDGGTGSQTFNFNNAPSTGVAASVNELAANLPAGWNFTSLGITGGDADDTSSGAAATLNVEPGENIVVTYTNTKRGRLIVQKTTIPAGDLTEFTILASGTGTITGGGAGTVTDALDKEYDVTPGTYSVAETVPTGWEKTGDTCQNVVVAAGETQTCLLTNRKQGKIIVEKQTNPDGAPGSFTFTGTVAGSIGDNGQLTVENLSPGTYNSTENDPAPGFDLASIVCDDANSTFDVGTRTATFNVEAGETVKCTFTNAQRGHIIVEKQTNPNNSTQSFEFDSDYGANFSLTDGQENDSGALAPGTYSVAELLPTGWDVDNVLCSDNSPRSAIELGAGETVRCVFTNTQRGSIRVQKFTVGGDGIFSFVNNFGLAASITTIGGVGSRQIDNLLPGNNYSISEPNIPGWLVGLFDCDRGTPGAIEVVAGEVTTCSVTNTRKGSIKVIKNTIGGDGTFSFISNFGVSSITTTNGMGMQLVEDVDPGNTYAIGETPLADWYEGNFSCDRGAPPNSIVVLPGELTTCTITNVKIPKLIVRKLVSTPEADIDSSDFTMHVNSADGNPDPASFPGSATGTTVNFDINGGSYNVTEDIPASTGPYSTNFSADCTGTVAPGEVKTCTVTNVFLTGFVTSSSLCTFDVDSGTDGAQFRLLFTPDVSTGSYFKLNASNPGQYYYNVLHFNDPSNPNDNSVTMNIPYPFVTHGATPVHVYSSVNITQNGSTCLIPGTEVSNQRTQLLLNGTFGSSQPVTVDVPEGFSYVNIHLDYGLKRTTPYSKGGASGNDALGVAPNTVNIPDNQPYTFTNGGSQTVYSQNSFKKNPGVGGLNLKTLDGDTSAYTFELWSGPNKKVATGVFDGDGWYVINYKHTGKAQTFTIKRLSGNSPTVSQDVLLKANGFLQVDFE